VCGKPTTQIDAQSIITAIDGVTVKIQQFASGSTFNGCAARGHTYIKGTLYGHALIIKGKLLKPGVMAGEQRIKAR